MSEGSTCPLWAEPLLGLVCAEGSLEGAASGYVVEWAPRIRQALVHVLAGCIVTARTLNFFNVRGASSLLHGVVVQVE